MNDAEKMRSLLKLLEAGTKQQTKTMDIDHDAFDIGDLVGDFDSKGELTTATSQAKQTPAPTAFGRTADRATGDAAIAGIGDKLDGVAASQAMRAFSDLIPAGDDDFDVDDTGPEGTPDEPTTLPATQSKAAATIDGPDVLWHDLPDLPMYRMVIGAFAPLFQHFGMEPREIKVCTTLTSGQADIQKMLAYIHKNGKRDDSFSIEAFDIPIENYHIEGAHLYDMGNERFLVMQERLGRTTNHYIYSAPLKGTDQVAQSSQRRLS